MVTLMNSVRISHEWLRDCLPLGNQRRKKRVIKCQAPEINIGWSQGGAIPS